MTGADILNLLLYTGRTVYESFKTKPVIATKSEADNRVQSNVSVNYTKGDLIVKAETTGKMSGTAAIN